MELGSVLLLAYFGKHEFSCCGTQHFKECRRIRCSVVSFELAASHWSESAGRGMTSANADSWREIQSTLSRSTNWAKMFSLGCVKPQREEGKFC